MKLTNLFYCFLLTFIFCLIKCETKIFLIFKIDGDEWNNEQEHQILRDKYGDPCLKVALRKCFKALMQVSKKVCKSYPRCNSTMKNDFKNEAKKKCLREFDYRQSTINKDSQAYSDENDNNKHTDETRERYLDVCIPHMVPQSMKTTNRSLRNDVLGNLVEQILRSRSERECKKLSRDKCNLACVDTSSIVCKMHECSKRKERSFKNTCKKVCSSAYQVRTIESSSDSGSSN
ncbi:uncharacterized protein LOC124540686 isoform X2 [Vanessa cardui]|uniref:uncharacterized protein LOC124540686 isoform X2 n=1 Tax=Vanessa cardui TaxID=171605 RepID=UPI001F12C7F0|nr:uncharacterized protein LOC124540686 isoform X2 [Vanessa cardui]